jgi:hypothetical protein
MLPTLPRMAKAAAAAKAAAVAKVGAVAKAAPSTVQVACLVRAWVGARPATC